MLLDLVEVAKSHSRVFANVLEDFGISDKVLLLMPNNKNDNAYLFSVQILGVTADNASNNDKMIEHLAILVDTFPGAANQTRCFAHILNLVSKSVLRQFESPKANSNKAMADAAEELAGVLDEIDHEGSGLRGNDSEADDVDDDVDDDVVDNDEDGLLDERDQMSEDELMSLEMSVKPIRLVLTKVSKSIQTPLQVQD